MASWKKKHLFNWRQKKDRSFSKKEETEINDLKVSNEKKIEKLYGMAKECDEEIKSLKSHMSQIMGDFERMHRYAQSEVQELKKEMKKNANETSLSINENRNIEARIICYENQLLLEQARLQLAKTKTEIQLRDDLSRLEGKIKEIKKITSSNRTR